MSKEREELQPIVWILDHPYLIVNFDIDSPPTHSNYLLLRPLGPEERENFRHAENECLLGCWAELICDEENRWKVR